MFQLKAQESPYGAEVEPDKAPEAISRSVASLPPEQMFELMKQMKQCVHNNPNEAKNLLMSNPQLAYALLQVLRHYLFLNVFLKRRGGRNTGWEISRVILYSVVVNCFLLGFGNFIENIKGSPF